jgi:hypothetical protein
VARMPDSVDEGMLDGLAVNHDPPSDKTSLESGFPLLPEGERCRSN